MMRCHTRQRHKTPAATPRRQRPWLEFLEERGSPSGLLGDGFAQTPLGTPVTLLPEWVSEEQTQSTTAMRLGGAEAALEANAGGGHGSVTATRDSVAICFTSFPLEDLLQNEGGNGPSTSDTGTPSREPPRIRGFHASEGRDGWWTFAGNVEADSPGGMVVYLGGLDALEGKAVDVNEDGTFSIDIRLPACEGGLATAQAMSLDEQMSEVVTDYVQQTGCP